MSCHRYSISNNREGGMFESFRRPRLSLLCACSCWLGHTVGQKQRKDYISSSYALIPWGNLHGEL